MAELDEALTVQEALRTMDADCAEILDRFFSRDESYHTIGEALSIPSGTIASRLSRCLRKLRLKLEGRKPRFEPSIER
jgi:DNA-directed RNA polymerase specialized sigma24 family protein